MKNSSPRNPSFAGRSSCARAQSAAVTRRACDVPTKLGTMEPIELFDPLGFSKGDEAKHGRVSMRAAVGAVAQHYVAQHYVKFPGFENAPAGRRAGTADPCNLGFTAFFFASGSLDGTSKQGAW